MHKRAYRSTFIRLITGICLLALSAVLSLAQTAGVPLQGTIADNKGGMIPGARVTALEENTGKTTTTNADPQGHFSFSGLPTGTYTVQATAPGFGTAAQKSIKLASDHADNVALTLQIGGASADITVEAAATGSIAAALAPMDALLDATSARTEITSAFINNFTSPVSDYGEDVEMTPGTFTTNGNGVGLGQSKTVFRGFPDGDYDIDFDGIPFYDTNTPSHHSWAFFPSQFLGGIDFDRSPGTASTIGPTPFGGSIHLLSKDMSPLDNIRGTFSGGSYNTYLYDGEYDSGNFGPGHKLNMNVDVHHLQSDGYETFNYQTRNAGALKLVWKPTPKLTITGFSGVIWLDANTPNFSATRCQMYGVSSTAAYSCALSGSTTGLYPYTGAGINFLNSNNSDPALYLDYQYNYYHVPTDFEYVGVHQEITHNLVLDIKPYTYNYDNSEKYANAVPISDTASLAGTVYGPLGAKIVLCTTPVTKSGVTAIPCGVDKYNSYRKYGETSTLSETSKFGIFRAGAWYEWANTNRHQYPSDPLNHWADQPLPNFAEKFVTNSYQPFAEYEFHATKKLSITGGVKFAYYTISTQQFADDGKTIGGLGTNNPASFITNGSDYFATLPAVSGNYHVLNNWSVYGQFAQGSIVPPSSVFDYAQGTNGTILPVAQLPKQQKNTTYQTGTVLKLKRVTFDADYYHIHFDNSYSCIANTQSGDDNVCTAQPPSITKGFEAESNIYIGHGFSGYLNASVGRAYYTGTQSVPCSTATCTAANLIETVPNHLWVQQTPSDIETEGLLYQKKAWDFGFFNKRVGTFYLDNTAKVNSITYTYHQQATINPFSLSNAFINYTLRSGGRFDQTKFRLSLNNIFNYSNVTGLTNSNSATTQLISANSTTYADVFNSVGQTPINGQDNISILPGRSIMFSVTFGFSPKK